MFTYGTSIVSLLCVGCAVTASPNEDLACVTAALEGELGVEPRECPGDRTGELGGKADGAGSQSPGLRFLRARTELELARLFAAGTAGHIPTGRNDGTPLLLGLDWLTPALGQVYVGSIWEPVLGDDGAPIVRPDGDPTIRLRDAWLRDGDGHLVTLFEADVSRGTLASAEVGDGIAPPSGPSRPHPLLPIYRRRLELDGKPSLLVNYHDDPTPVINRILDEIREVDAVGCPGLYLGRAHYRRPSAEWVYLYWFALDFGPSGRPCAIELP